MSKDPSLSLSLCLFLSLSLSLSPSLSLSLSLFLTTYPTTGTDGGLVMLMVWDFGWSASLMVHIGCAVASILLIWSPHSSLGWVE